ncbi:hypothetical protein ACOMICROBIO_GDFFDHBD_02999 [Vibrio sp. B1REV9]|uniref:hypothetical protein n=1 Tax=Vibrio sp. B1REV9 TaxID=2751179 RepID=UPI001AFBD909|nr:hypothetical protein [Vibrio sp. B1REV9]CAE6937656.1 hypothetical protein ACOMICROBIO_GDFFDHBD_02999 [Vibrio sp. B1REV9]
MKKKTAFFLSIMCCTNITNSFAFDGISIDVDGIFKPSSWEFNIPAESSAKAKGVKIFNNDAKVIKIGDDEFLDFDLNNLFDNLVFVQGSTIKSGVSDFLKVEIESKNGPVIISDNSYWVSRDAEFEVRDENGAIIPNASFKSELKGAFSTVGKWTNGNYYIVMASNLVDAAHKADSSHDIGVAEAYLNTRPAYEEAYKGRVVNRTDVPGGTVSENITKENNYKESMASFVGLMTKTDLTLPVGAEHWKVRIPMTITQA